MKTKSYLKITGKSNRGFKTEYAKTAIQSYLMILPQTIGLILFSIIPILYILKYGFYNYDGIKATFIGFDNFIRAFTRDSYFWSSMLNTFIFSFGKLAIEIPLALLLAVFVNQKIRGRNALRVIFFMPNILSTAIVSLIFYFMFSAFEGIVNNILLTYKFIGEPVNWFGDKWLAMIVIMLASIWQNFGINMLFFLSGLQAIPKELYECAEVDGANSVKRFFHITLPMLFPVIQVILMLALIGSMTMTDLVLVLTNGQPAGSTEVAMTYIFKRFFGAAEGNSILEIGYASALSIITTIILVIMTVFYLRITKKMTNKE